MFITVRVSLQPHTTEERAKELGNNIATHVKDAVGPGPSQHIDKVYLAVDEGDGNYVGP
jgi:hypothetical protein